MTYFAANLQRLMARDSLTIREVARRTGLAERTVKSLLTGTCRRPHAQTLHKLASGLEVAADELFQNPALLARRLFDRRTNTMVDDVVRQRPELFDGWREADFDELYSRFGTGGGLTPEGTLHAVNTMNENRRVQQRVAILLESAEAELLREFVAILYRRITLQEPGDLQQRDHAH